jgi:hypothetical protein
MWKHRDPLIACVQSLRDDEGCEITTATKTRWSGRWHPRACRRRSNATVRGATITMMEAYICSPLKDAAPYSTRGSKETNATPPRGSIYVSYPWHSGRYTIYNKSSVWPRVLGLIKRVVLSTVLPFSCLWCGFRASRKAPPPTAVAKGPSFDALPRQ